MNETESWVMDAVTGPNTLREVRHALAEVWKAHGEVPERVRSEMAIAAGEVAANIVEHAGKGRPVRIRMQVRVSNDGVELRFFDDGERVQVDLHSVRLPDESAERGRGLAVAQAVLRHLSYDRTADGNQWTLVSERFGD